PALPPPLAPPPGKRQAPASRQGPPPPPARPALSPFGQRPRRCRCQATASRPRQRLPAPIASIREFPVVRKKFDCAPISDPCNGRRPLKIRYIHMFGRTSAGEISRAPARKEQGELLPPRFCRGPGGPHLHSWGG